MNDSPSLGDTIRDRRLALGYSLGQLATKVNKTASSIRAWERGDALPSDDESEELAAALDLDAALLATLREPPEVWDSEEVEEVDVHDPWSEDDEASQSSSDASDASQAVVAAASVEVQDQSRAAPADDEANDLQAAGAAPEETQPEAAAEPPAEPVAAVEGAAGDAADGAAGAIADKGSLPDPDEFAEMFEAKTEAVPVVPPTSVAVAQPQPDPLLSTATAQPVETRSDNPVVAAWDDLRALYYRIFDPRRRWIYRVRFVLILIAFFIMLRVLAWAAGNLFDALGEVLDSVSFNPGETPDVEN